MRPTGTLCKRSAMEPAVQGTIQIERGADQGNMGEGLWKVAKGLATTTDFLRIQPHVIGVSQHPLEQQSSFRELCGIDASGSGQRFHQPKRTHGKGALLSTKPIVAGLGIIPEDESIGDQSTLLRRAIDGVD